MLHTLAVGNYRSINNLVMPLGNLNLITGASGTTDIEGSLVLGAHGPRYLHVVIVEDAPAA